MGKTIEQLIEEKDKLHDELIKVDVGNTKAFLNVAAKLQPVYKQIKELGYSPFIKKEDL